jgi:flagellar basal-body rod modification protein FlgD
MEVSQFLDLLIAQLQNQDPLEPMENSEMMAQIAQMREISSTDKLSDTLDAMIVGQQLSTATSMIGKRVQALTDEGTNIEGVVDRVSVGVGSDETRSLRVHIGQTAISLDNIREVVATEQ